MSDQVVEVVEEAVDVEVLPFGGNASSIGGRSVDTSLPTDKDLFYWDDAAGAWQLSDIDSLLVGNFVDASGGTFTGAVTFSGGLNTDTVDEESAGAGVTVDGVLLKDGAIADGAVPETSVTQHEAALSIAGSQLTGSVPIGTLPSSGSWEIDGDLVVDDAAGTQYLYLDHTSKRVGFGRVPAEFVDVDGNVRIRGSVQIDGSLVTVESETVTIADNVLLLNSNQTGTPTEDGGLEVERGDSTNSGLQWIEGPDRWQAGILGALHTLAYLDGDTWTGTHDFTGATLDVPEATITAHEAALSVAVGQLTGTLGVTSGGTGLATVAVGSVLYADATDSLATLAPATDGQILTLVTGSPAWADAPETGAQLDEANSWTAQQTFDVTVAADGGVEVYDPTDSFGLKLEPGGGQGGKIIFLQNSAQNGLYIGGTQYLGLDSGSNFNVKQPLKASSTATFQGAATFNASISAPRNTNTEVFGAGADPNDSDSSVVIGQGASITAAGLDNSVVIGQGASHSVGDGNAVVIGQGASAARRGVVIGQGASGTSFDATAVGVGATSAARGVAIGKGASTSGSNVAIGFAASADEGVGVVLGRGASQTAANQMVVGAPTLHIADVYIGSGVVDAAPVATTYHGTGGSGTDIDGANISIAGGKGTGAAAGGAVIIKYAAAGGSGSSPNALAEVARFDGSGLTLPQGSDLNLFIGSNPTGAIAWDSSNKITLDHPSNGGLTFEGAGKEVTLNASGLLGEQALVIGTAQGSPKNLTVRAGSVSTSNDGSSVAVSGGQALTSTFDGGDARIYGGATVDADEGRVLVAHTGSALRGFPLFGGPASAPSDGRLLDGTWTAWLDEAGNELEFKVKYSDGTVKTGTVALS